MFGRASITLGIGPHSSLYLFLGPLHFQVGSCKRRPSVGLSLSYSIFCVPDAWLFCIVVNLRQPKFIVYFCGCSPGYGHPV